MTERTVLTDWCDGEIMDERDVVSVPWCVTCDKPACTTCDGPPHHYRDGPCVIKGGVVWKVADDE